MAKEKDTNGKPRIPKVRVATPKNRPMQLRYFCPIENREIRISTGTHDEEEAIRQKGELEAKLLLGIALKREPKKTTGPNMSWEYFRDRYTRLQLVTLRKKSAVDAESRLDVAERILKPRTLADVANSDSLHTLQAKLLAGVESRFGKRKTPDGDTVWIQRPRSPHTVKGYMTATLTALNWAVYMEWLPSVPKVRRVKVSKLKHMKGRPLAGEEFERMLAVTESVVGPVAAGSWKYLLRGLRESGLRLSELMSVSWTDSNMILPDWPRRGDPVLRIPHEQQKNATEEAIPLLPGFEALLLETPESRRTGWAFNPVSLETRIGRRVRHGRPDPDWVGKVICRIGKKAGVVVIPADPAKEAGAKFASAHDLRRSCAQRLDDAGVPEIDIMRVMRHRDRETLRRHYAPGSVQKSAGRIRQYLGTPEPVI